MNFSIKNFFSKCEHIHIKLRIYTIRSSFNGKLNFLCREYYWFYYWVLLQVFLQT